MFVRAGFRSAVMQSSLAAAAFLTLGSALRADDWPQWLGPQRDGVWRETGIVDKLPADGPRVLWRTPIGAGYTGPAVADGHVYVMDRQAGKGKVDPANFSRGKSLGSERILCLNEKDGKIVWVHEYDCPYTVSYPLGPRTTPTVKDHRVYTLGTEGNVFCLDADTGKILWSHELKKEFGAKTPIWGFSSHLLIDGPRVISMAGGKGTDVVAWDKDTGKELWRALDAKEPGYAPPMIYELAGKRQLIVWDADAVHGLDPETGTVYWSQPVKTYSGMAISTPRQIHDDVYLTAFPGISLLLHVQSQEPRINVVWKGAGKKKGFFSVFDTPFVEDGYIYGTSTNGALVCIKTDTGDLVWSTMAPNKGKKAESGGFLVKNGDRYFIWTEIGDLILAKLTPDAKNGYEEISRAHLLEPTSYGMGKNNIVVWSHPAFANKCIFARNDKEIICASLAADQASK